MPQIFTTFEEVQCQDNGKIELRKEQLEAIKEAKDRFKQKAGNKFLWNAKMRFGKTVCALQLAKELGYRRILIVTVQQLIRNGWRHMRRDSLMLFLNIVMVQSQILSLKVLISIL